MQIKDIKLALAASTCAAAIVISAPVLAQDESDGASSDDTIYVTARKREERLIEVPLPVTVANEEQLKRDQIYNVNDLQRVTPALEISQTSGGESNGGGRLRGIGTGVFNPSVASSVALVIDQVPIGNLNFPLLYDMAQVEVLRGPQGTLFGAGASAGVLNITTRAPSVAGIAVNGSVDFADKGTAGSEVGELVANAGFNLPLGQSAAIRIAGQYKMETGLQRSVTTGKDNEIEDWGIRGRLLFEPTDTLSATLTVEHAENTSDGQTFFAIAIAPDGGQIIDPDFGGPAPAGPIGQYSTGAYTNPNGCGVTISERAEEYCEDVPSYLTTSISAVSLIVDLDLTDTLSLSSVTAYRERQFNQFSRDFSRLTGAPAARQEGNKENSDGFSQELRANVSGDRIDLVIGGIYSQFSFENSPIGDGPFNYGSALPGERIGFSVCVASGFFCVVPPRFSQQQTDNHIVSAFADATFSLTDQFDIFGGLRFDNYKNTNVVTNYPAIPGNVGGPSSAPQTFEVEDDNLSGRIGVSYRPNPDVNIFGSYSRGYKPPAVGTDVDGLPFQLAPEKTNAFEIGAKFAVGGLQLAANAFYTELLDFQSQRSEFSGSALVSRQLNIPKIESKGFELTAFGQLFEGFNFNAGYQFNDIKYPSGFPGDDAIDTNGDGVFDDNITSGLPFLLGDTQFLNAPKHKFTLSGDYGYEMTSGLELFLNANLVYKSEVLLASRADPRYRYPAHELINLGLGVRDPAGTWNASLFVRNLTKEREPTAMLASTFLGAADGGVRYWPVAGQTARVVGIRAGFDF